MDTEPQLSSAEAWLDWFFRHKALQYRTTLGTRYGLNILDANALINAACFDVFYRWERIEHPMTIFAIQLRRHVRRYFGSRTQEQSALLAYAETVQQDAQYQERDAQHQARLATRVETVLETVAPPERELLMGFAQDVDDQAMATRLGITAAAVRGRRHRLYRKLQQRSA